MFKKIAAGAMLAGLLTAGAVVNPAAAGADPRGCAFPWIDPPGPGCLPPPGHLKGGPWPFDGPPGHWPVNPGKVNHW